MLAGAIAIVVLGVLQGTVWGQDSLKDSKVAGAITTVVTFVVQYLVPERKYVPNLL